MDSIFIVVAFFIAVSLLSIPCMMYYKKKEKKEQLFFMKCWNRAEKQQNFFMQ